MREVVLDTETTGLDPYKGHRLVSIGCVELENHMPTGNKYYQLINPERDVPEEVVKVHGLTNEILDKEPPFRDIVDEFLAFIGDSPLVIHNAEFDMKFINAELSWLKRNPIPMDRAIDTLLIARQKFPGSRVNLDELCRRFGVDNSKRTTHGALLDSELLADVYLELLGGKEPAFLFDDKKKNALEIKAAETANAQTKKPRIEPRPPVFLDGELENHEAFVKKLKNPIWLS